MAKNKKGKKGSGNQTAVLSPERWLREKARTTPLMTTYMKSENGMATVLVSRRRPSGNVAMALFLVDTYCLGVKDVIVNPNLTPGEWEERRKEFIERFGLEETPYDVAHNLIYGAVEWAGEADIDPCPEWSLARYMLEEDTEDIPYIEMEFGDNGKYHLIVAQRPGEARLIPRLQARLGDRFICTVMSDDDEYPYDDDDESLADLQETPCEPWHYDNPPEYPSECHVKNEWLKEALLDPANSFGLPEEVTDRIMALPADEAAADIARIIHWEAGRTREQIEEDPDDVPDDSAILLGLMLLSLIDSDKAFDAIADIVHQSKDFTEAHLGDYTEELLSQALYRAKRNDPAALVELMATPGLCSYNRYSVAQCLGMIAYNEPGRRDEIINIFRDELRRIAAALPDLNGADGEYAGFVVSMLRDLKAKELIEEIKAMYDTGLMNTFIAGDFSDVSNDFDEGNTFQSFIFHLRTLDEFNASLTRSRAISESETR